jgi:hypothetical protein
MQSFWGNLGMHVPSFSIYSARRASTYSEDSLAVISLMPGVHAGRMIVR